MEALKQSATDRHVPRYALLPGDPARVKRLTDRLDQVVVTLTGAMPRATGSLAGEPVLVAATGMGGPSVARTMTDISALGVDSVIRVGGAGPVADGVAINDIVVATAAVRHEAASDAFLPPDWPAVADPAVVQALLAAASRRGQRARCGVVHTKDSFFGEVDPSSSPVETELRQLWTALQRLNVLASEMEAATLFAAATAMGVRAGAVVKINDPDGALDGEWTGEDDLCDLAIAGLSELITSDREVS